MEATLKTLNVSKAILVETPTMDHVVLETDLPSTAPHISQEPAQLLLICPYGTGAEYVKRVLGLEVEKR